MAPALFPEGEEMVRSSLAVMGTFLASVCLLLTVCVASWPAPVPPVRPRPSFLGYGHLKWHHTEYECVHEPDGRCWHRRLPDGEKPWIGTWKLEGDILTYEEEAKPPDDDGYVPHRGRWRIVLHSRKWQGTIKETGNNLEAITFEWEKKTPPSR